TYVRGAGNWTYLYRAVDSAGDTIDFILSPKRDLTAAKLFLRLALSGSGGIRPRVINVDKHPAYARAIAELKQSGALGAVDAGLHLIETTWLSSPPGSLRSASRRASGSGRRKGHGGRSRVTRQCM